MLKVFTWGNYVKSDPDHEKSDSKIPVLKSDQKYFLIVYIFIIIHSSSLGNPILKNEKPYT